jgi:hypothetical protein
LALAAVMAACGGLNRARSAGWAGDRGGCGGGGPCGRWRRQNYRGCLQVGSGRRNQCAGGGPGMRRYWLGCGMD